MIRLSEKTIIQTCGFIVNSYLRECRLNTTEQFYKEKRAELCGISKLIIGTYAKRHVETAIDDIDDVYESVRRRVKIAELKTK